MFTKSEAVKAAIAAEYVTPGNVLHIVGNTDGGEFHIVTREGRDVMLELVRSDAGAIIARRVHTVELTVAAADILAGDGIGWANSEGRGVASGVTTALAVSRVGDVVTVRTSGGDWTLDASDVVTLYRS